MMLRIIDVCLSPLVKLPIKFEGYLKRVVYLISIDIISSLYNVTVYQSYHYYRKLYECDARAMNLASIGVSNQ